MSVHVAGSCPLWQEMGLLSMKEGYIKVPVEVGSPEGWLCDSCQQ